MATSEMTGETSAQSVEEPSGMSEEGGTSSAIENRIKLVSIEIKRVELVRLSQKNGSKANVTHDILVYLSDSSRYPESSENEIVAMFWVDAQAKGRQVSESEGLALFGEWIPYASSTHFFCFVLCFGHVAETGRLISTMLSLDTLGYSAL